MQIVDDRQLRRKRAEIERAAARLELAQKEKPAPKPRLTFGFFMKWLAALGLAGVSAYIALLVIIAAVVLLLVCLELKIVWTLF